jgi:hypothetical protein
MILGFMSILSEILIDWPDGNSNPRSLGFMFIKHKEKCFVLLIFEKKIIVFKKPVIEMVKRIFNICLKRLKFSKGSVFAVI